MLKKTMVMGIILTGICTAPTLAHTSYFKSGFLAGAHVGITNSWGTFNGTFFTNDARGRTSRLTGRERKTSALWGVFGGYRHIFSQGYTLGLDVSLNFLTNNELSRRFNHFNQFNFRNNLSRQYNMTPSVNFGKIICDRFHVSLGLGLAVSRFKLRVNDENIETPGSFNASQTRLGFAPTLGVEYAITQNVSILGNMSYEIYPDMKRTFNVYSSTSLPGSTYTSSISPRYLTLKVGAVYRF